MPQSLEALVERARDALGAEAQPIGGGAGEVARFTLFHGANSICSQKVRAVLEHHRIPCTGYTLNMFRGQTYLPDYVRLRMLGCEQSGMALVSVHTGSTSTSVGGCDGAVVPTLVDWGTGGVIVDSKRICLYLDEQVSEAAKLRPAALANAVDEELAIVDNLPNYQMLMGRKPGASEGADTKDGHGSQFSMKKVVWCDQYLKEAAGDDTLVQAYTAKRSKELSAANGLFSAEAMAAAYAKAESALKLFNDKLRSRATPWLFGDAVTMADIFWGIELLRMKNMGVATFWEGGRLPQVAAFSTATEALLPIRTAILEWPEAMF